MDPFYTQQLYPLQDQVLNLVKRVETDFYLTGGTAVSRGYLNHQYSDDLDFFVNDDDRFELWGERVIHTLNAERNWRLEVALRQPRYLRLNLFQETIFLKLEFINDVPAHVGQITSHPSLGRLDSAENMLANKLTALTAREEPKDLADIWGLCTKLGLSLQAALSGAQSKAAGIFPVDLARILLSVTKVDWEVIKWANAPEPEIYVRELGQLGEQLLLLKSLHDEH